jgi:two-component system response regulator FixJ
MSHRPLVHVVDDNEDMRRSLTLLLRTVAIETKCHASADSLVEAINAGPTQGDAVLLDVRLPGISGISLLERLRRDHPGIPVIMISGYGDVDTAVHAMKLGAVDFITKPFSGQALLERLQTALRQTRGQADRISTSEAVRRLASLSPRERQVFDRIVAGEANRDIADALGISVRTVESHRSQVMDKTGSKSIVELVRLSMATGDS